MNKCINCKHWENGRGSNFPNTAKCAKLTLEPPESGVLVDLNGVCDELEPGWEGSEEYSTGKDFGCIYFESK